MIHLHEGYVCRTWKTPAIFVRLSFVLRVSDSTCSKLFCFALGLISTGVNYPPLLSGDCVGLHIFFLCRDTSFILRDRCNMVVTPTPTQHYGQYSIGRHMGTGKHRTETLNRNKQSCGWWSLVMGLPQHLCTRVSANNEEEKSFTSDRWGSTEIHRDVGMFKFF